jgi:hypothetical protein
MSIRPLICAAAICAASGVHALPFSPSERAETFAICAGRYAAQETYWAAQQPASEERKLFEALLEAVMPAAIEYGMPESHAANAMFHAWKTHAYLRNDANFAVDARRKSGAAARLARDMADCRELIT